MKNAIYETSLTDAQWAYLNPMLSKPAKRGRPPTDQSAHPRCHSRCRRSRWLPRCGRYLPTDFPPWQTVYHLSSADIGPSAPRVERPSMTHCAHSSGKLTASAARPTAAILDSQSREVRRTRRAALAMTPASGSARPQAPSGLVDTLGAGARRGRDFPQPAPPNETARNWCWAGCWAGFTLAPASCGWTAATPVKRSPT